jgi:hypothetical protein
MGTRGVFFSYIGPPIDNPVDIREIDGEHYKWLASIRFDAYPDHFEGIWNNCKDVDSFIVSLKELYDREDSPIITCIDKRITEFHNVVWTENVSKLTDYIYVWFSGFGIYFSRFGNRFAKFYFDVEEALKFLPRDKLNHTEQLHD